MSHGSGKIESVGARVEEIKEKNEYVGYVEVLYGGGHKVTFSCYRKNPCQWTAFKKRINDEYVESVNLKLSDDMIGALEEAWQRDVVHKEA